MNGAEELPEMYDYDLIIIGGGSGGLAAAKARLRVLWDMGGVVTSPTKSPASLWNLSYFVRFYTLTWAGRVRDVFFHVELYMFFV